MNHQLSIDYSRQQAYLAANPLRQKLDKQGLSMIRNPSTSRVREIIRIIPERENPRIREILLEKWLVGDPIFAFGSRESPQCMTSKPVDHNYARTTLATIG